MISAPAEQAILVRQIDHWQRALERLGRFDEIAAPAAWASLSPAVNAAIREPFVQSVTNLMADLNALRRRAARSATDELPALYDRLGAFRQQYSRIETTFDFFGDAINSRTNPTMQAVLAGLDRLATLSMRRLLDPLRRPVPPVLTYVDRGLGASILKAGVRLWEPSIVGPAAVIKIARHNLMRPTALIHETGHQVAHIIGWNEELAATLLDGLSVDSRELASVWASWSSEIAADTYAFAQTGYASVANLHDVLAGDSDYVLRFIPGDPHPVSYIRVLLTAEMCNAAFGAGPWRELAESWIRRYRLADADRQVADLMTASIPLLPRIARLCLETPMQALGGRPLTYWIDPSEVSPKVLTRLNLAAGGALLRSPSWSRAETLRTLALIGLRMVTDTDKAASLNDEQQQWLQRLSTLPAAA